MPTASAMVARLTIPADARYLGICRLAAAGIAGSTGLADAGMADLQLAMSEVCADAVLHTRPPSRIRVMVTLPAGEVEVAVGSAEPADRHLPELLTTLLDRLCSRWQFGRYAAGDTVVTFAVPRPPG